MLMLLSALTPNPNAEFTVDPNHPVFGHLIRIFKAVDARICGQRMTLVEVVVSRFMIFTKIELSLP